MKLLLLTSAILLLASCQQYRYDVTYEKCNGQTGSITTNQLWYDARGKYITTRESLGDNFVNIYNVCDFSYQRNPIE